MFFFEVLKLFKTSKTSYIDSWKRFQIEEFRDFRQDKNQNS